MILYRELSWWCWAVTTVLLAARRGEIAFYEAFGFADRAAARPARIDDVFFSMSIAKQLTNAMVIMRVERSDIRLNTPVADVIPEFAQFDLDLLEAVPPLMGEDFEMPAGGCLTTAHCDDPGPAASRPQDPADRRRGGRV